MAKPREPAHDLEDARRHGPHGKRVLTRVDINVPVEDGRVTDATRIERIVPTIADILAKGGSPVLLAHFGRPKGKPDPEMSLRIVLPALEAALGRRSSSPSDPDRAFIDAQAPDAVILVENTRFHPGEEKNDPDLAAPRRARRRLCQRCLLGRAPGACLDRRRGASPALLRRAADGGGAARARSRADHARAARGGGRGRARRCRRSSTFWATSCAR
jgi:hypothetical protein